MVCALRRFGICVMVAVVTSVSNSVTVGAQQPTLPKPAVPSTPTGIEGVVVDSAGRPLANARLAVRDTARTGAAALRRTTGESDSLGRFRIVGLPPGLHVLEVLREEYEPAGFQFTIATGITAQIRITLARDPMWAEMKRTADSLLAGERADSIAEARAAALARSEGGSPGGATPSAAQFGTGMLQGRVSTPDGQPVGRVQVQAMGTNFFTQTDTTGRFRIADLPVGPYFLRARKVGYDPVVFSATIMRGDSLDASVTLIPFSGARGQRLDTVRVTADAQRTSRRLQGFEERRRSARGFFIDEKEIMQRQPSYLSDLLRGRANITVQRNGNSGETVVYGPRLSISSGYCQLALIIDGVLIQNAGAGIDALVPPQMIAGVEVYNSGTSVPSEFTRLGTDCGAIVVWTR